MSIRGSIKYKLRPDVPVDDLERGVSGTPLNISCVLMFLLMNWKSFVLR